MTSPTGAAGFKGPVCPNSGISVDFLVLVLGQKGKSLAD